MGCGRKFIVRVGLLPDWATQWRIYAVFTAVSLIPAVFFHVSYAATSSVAKSVYEPYRVGVLYSTCLFGPTVVIFICGVIESLRKVMLVYLTAIISWLTCGGKLWCCCCSSAKKLKHHIDYAYLSDDERNIYDFIEKSESLQKEQATEVLKPPPPNSGPTKEQIDEVKELATKWSQNSRANSSIFDSCFGSLKAKIARAVSRKDSLATTKSKKIK